MTNDKLLGTSRSLNYPRPIFGEEEYLTAIGDDRPHDASKLVFSGHPLRRPRSVMVSIQVLMIRTRGRIQDDENTRIQPRFQESCEDYHHSDKMARGSEPFSKTPKRPLKRYLEPS